VSFGAEFVAATAARIGEGAATFVGWSAVSISFLACHLLPPIDRLMNFRFEISDFKERPTPIPPIFVCDGAEGFSLGEKLYVMARKELRNRELVCDGG
jgi:hypothetical protein